jgi:signal-transduction protein with cAMP-binding, CBS, and nucleotidyltransferase domain
LRIVLVIDTDRRLKGTVTDGDIRRALIRGIGIDSDIKNVMEKEPVTVLSNRDRPSVVALMKEKDLLQLPVLDSTGKVIGLETMQELVYGQQRGNPVLLMVGGFGRRLLPLTEQVPKPLLKVGRKPLLESIVEQRFRHLFS